MVDRPSARARAWLRRQIDNWSQHVNPHETDGTATAESDTGR